MASRPTYYELLRHPNWQRKRLEIMERAEFACEDCGANSQTLNVHHTYYEKGCDPWEYPNESLHCLCEDCHKTWEAARRDVQRQIGRLSLCQINELIGFARGLEMEEFPVQQHSADNHEQLQGMMRVFVTLNHRELGRYVASAVALIDDSKQVDGNLLLSAVEGVAEVDERLNQPSLQMSLVHDSSGA